MVLGGTREISQPGAVGWGVEEGSKNLSSLFQMNSLVTNKSYMSVLETTLMQNSKIVKNFSIIYKISAKSDQAISVSPAKYKGRKGYREVKLSIPSLMVLFTLTIKTKSIHT